MTCYRVRLTCTNVHPRNTVRRVDEPHYDDAKDGIIHVVTDDPRLIHDRWGENVEVIEVLGVGLMLPEATQ